MFLLLFAAPQFSNSVALAVVLSSVRHISDNVFLEAAKVNETGVHTRPILNAGKCRARAEAWGEQKTGLLEVSGFQRASKAQGGHFRPQGAVVIRLTHCSLSGVDKMRTQIVGGQQADSVNHLERAGKHRKVVLRKSWQKEDFIRRFPTSEKDLGPFFTLSIPVGHTIPSCDLLTSKVNGKAGFP
ncbi:hypothetical protein L345_07844, partial [Ophiophagus hannah]